MKIIYLWIVALFLYSCSPDSSREFVREGQARYGLLAKELQKIETREDLIVAEPRLKKHFESLVELMIQARRFQQQYPEEEIGDLVDDVEGNIELENQLRRIYQIEGGREIIERAQHEALVRLDAYENSLIKRRKQRNHF